MKAFKRSLIIAALALVTAACTHDRKSASPQDGEWQAGGRDAAGTYYSPLHLINAGNVGQLGFAWAYDMGTARGQEATPLVIGGVMYTSGVWGHVYALDAKTGALLWHYDPQVPGALGRNACCDVVNRGVAYRDGVVFVASEDGRLHAIDAKTGKARWIADTIIDHRQPYSSTGGVLLTKDAVIIGNSGADMRDGGLRGYISAWDIKTGAFKWRFFTVPPAPGKPFENPELALAAKSWAPNFNGKYQNGGTVWDGLSYDAGTGLIIFGTANAAPYLPDERGGDARSADLFNASIVAVHADTGRMAWYYQETPGDRWDFDAVQKFILADLTIGGAPHKVVMQASKNGFFYVLDRVTGKLLAADPFTYVNWAKGIDMKTGLPMFTARADYSKQPQNINPSWAGGHTWNPMSYDQDTGLVYIPSIDASNVWIDLKTNGGSIKHLEGFFSTNGQITDDTYDAAAMKRIWGPVPDLKTLQPERHGTRLVREVLEAWDPVQHKIVWQHVTSSGDRGYDGGVLSTAGNLVIQGRGDGHLWVYDAHSGKPLKDIDTGSHIMAAPMTYAIDGVQYVAVQTGYGGSGIGYPIPPSSAAFKRGNENRIVVFKLGGGATPIPPIVPDEPYPAPPPSTASLAEIQHGEDKFTEQCSRCHVFGQNITPNLGKLPAGVHQAFDDIVLKGMLAPAGMANFSDVLTPADVHAIHAYLIDQQRQGYQAQQKARGLAVK
jgi:quinohemoprotein ethanol dehydrogenase